MKNLFSASGITKIKVVSFVLLFLTMAACDPNNNYGNQWDPAPRQDPYYNSGYGSRYGNDYDRYHGYPRDRYENRDKYQYDRDRYNDYREQKERDEYRKHQYENKYQPTPYPTPAPRPQENIIRPSCPSGTSFDGKHCIIPEGQRRPGGKGTVNACPKGMWLSGDKCVPN
ncbi:MAG: hypothetical protein KBC84_00930 [Proteobacteria bacterium]|nr:hypothetical protein [Pseudomonadota bacterium]